MRSVLPVAFLPIVLACGSTAPAEPDDEYVSELYQDLAHWLCHPEQLGDDDRCSAPLDTSLVAADGTVTVETHQPAAAPAVDCFYVYPTVSADPSDYSDLEIGPDEVFIAENQAARFNAVCRVFAPVYRQLTISALLNAGDIGPDDFEPAYADVLDAFRHYLAQHNDGRGFLLLGHSQGSVHLIRLLKEEVEAEPALHDRMIAAYLLGMTVEVPAGEDVGGAFEATPACRSSTQTGCVVSYASYRETEPPVSATSLFGETSDASTHALCNHPAALAGGRAELAGYFPVTGEGTLSSFVLGSPFAEPAAHEPLTTPHYGMPGLVSGECVDRDGHQYLEISIAADTSDPRADDIAGDLTQGWGLHLIDVNVALGDLVALAGAQAEAWLAR